MTFERLYHVAQIIGRAGITDEEFDFKLDFYEREYEDWKAQSWQRWTEKKWQIEFGLLKPKKEDLTAEQIKENVSLLEIIANYTKMTKKGIHWFGKCPFHNEKTPSFCVFTDGKHYKCFGCNSFGDVIDFIMQIQKLSFKEALNFLSAWL